ncbi:hypothetical protein SELMODRAFT_407644 [Selaginella moellendorffii]|uniref:Uncharacterized protein n=1 Tax=Selaginella moellendorffii TaxID=88036 RepID=D8R699_SELML|nr:hypothetical protein SELMODRAFT_407644 [Selaginella moellendorffii]
MSKLAKCNMKRLVWVDDVRHLVALRSSHSKEKQMIGGLRNSSSNCPGWKMSPSSCGLASQGSPKQKCSLPCQESASQVSTGDDHQLKEGKKKQGNPLNLNALVWKKNMSTGGVLEQDGNGLLRCQGIEDCIRTRTGFVRRIKVKHELKRLIGLVRCSGMSAALQDQRGKKTASKSQQPKSFYGKDVSWFFTLNLGVGLGFC